MSKPVLLALFASVFAVYGLFQSSVLPPAPGVVQAWEQGLDGLAAGLSGHSSGTRIQYRGPKRTLALRLVVERPKGGELEVVPLGSVTEDEALRTDLVAVASIEDLNERAGDSQLLSIQMASPSGLEWTSVRSLVDAWLPESTSGYLEHGFGHARTLDDDEGVTILERSYSDGQGSLRVECRFE